MRRRHFPGIRPPGKGRPHFQKRNFQSAPGALTQPPPDSAPFPLHVQGSRAVLGEVCVGGWGGACSPLNPPHPSAQTGLRAAEVEGAGHHVALSGPLDTFAASSGQSRAGPSPSCPAVTTCRGIPWAAAARQAWPGCRWPHKNSQGPRGTTSPAVLLSRSQMRGWGGRPGAAASEVGGGSGVFT